MQLYMTAWQMSAQRNNAKACAVLCSLNFIATNNFKTSSEIGLLETSFTTFLHNTRLSFLRILARRLQSIRKQTVYFFLYYVQIINCFYGFPEFAAILVLNS